MTPLNEVRWGDRQRLVGVVGQSIVTPEFFRVTAPFPTVYRVLGLVEAGDPALAVILRLYVGLGSALSEFLFATPLSTTFSFEVPAQSISGRFETGNFLVAAPIVCDVRVAPLIPWQDLNVKIQR